MRAHARTKMGMTLGALHAPCGNARYERRCWHRRRPSPDASDAGIQCARGSRNPHRRQPPPDAKDAAKLVHGVVVVTRSR